MENKLTTSRELLLPILLGGLSILGIGTVFLFGSSISSSTPVPVNYTDTPFRYIYLGTEPGLSTQTPMNTPTDVPTDTPESIIVLDTPTRLVNPTQVIVRTPTVTTSPTVPAVLSIFDDTYYEILYTGDWVSESDVDNTHQNTLHLSFEAGNSASFTFVGQQVILSFQAGPSLGRISINLDGLLFEVDQSNATTEIKKWTSALLVKGTHTIQISHLSGGSVNIDSIIIPDVSTPTPTATSTP